MRIAKLRGHSKEYLEEKVNSYKRDFRVKEVTYIEKDKSYLAFVEYEYKSYPDTEQINKEKLSARLYNCLRRHNIDTLGELKHIFLTGELKGFRNLGDKCIKEAADILSKVYKADFNSLLDSILGSCGYLKAIDYNRSIKVGVDYYW